ncbi:unnamed protein product, partial [marine sediment metagenome]
SWELLTDGNGIASTHFVRVVREDPALKGLLYAGTEFGMYVSFDDGKHWQSLQLNLPVTPITDLTVYQNDLVVATQGRSFWILDDLTPLNQLSNEIANAQAYLFKPRDTYRMVMSSSRGYSGGYSAAENPPNGVMIFYYFAGEPEDEVIIEIMDEKGNIIQNYSSEREKREPRVVLWGRKFRGDRKVAKKDGMNRFVRDLRLSGADLIDGSVIRHDTIGPRVVPGAYKVKLKVDDWSQIQSFQILKDPRIETTQAEFQD